MAVRIASRQQRPRVVNDAQPGRPTPSCGVDDLRPGSYCPNVEQLEPDAEAVVDGQEERVALFDLGEQPPGDYWGDLPQEKGIYWDYSYRAANWIIKRPSRVAAGLRVFVVRCPERGCYLSDVYRLPLRSGGERFIVVTNMVRGESKCGFLNWVFSDDWRGPPVYFPATCRHGSVRLERAWLLDCLAIVYGWHHAMETEEDAFEKSSVEQRRGRARRVFHPPAQVWRAKRRS